MFNSYSAAVFVAGGSGITFALSAVRELIQQDLKGESRVRVIGALPPKTSTGLSLTRSFLRYSELIWVVQDAASLLPLVPQFTAMIQQPTYVRLNISVHYTKAVVGKMRLPNTLPLGLTLNAGRPRLISLIESTASLAVNVGGGEVCGMIVGVCGPTGLGDDVTKSVGLVDPAKRDQIGGIEVHEE